MKIQSITVEGLWSYRESVRVDIAGLPLLVAVGHNGSGKSALVVSAVIAGLYAKFPTRTLQESITVGKDAGDVIVEFTVNDVLYRVSRHFPRKGNSTASLWQNVGQGWEPVTEGKLTGAVNAKVIELIGMDYDTAVMTWIAEQGKYGQFASAPAPARFKMLANVFDLAKFGPLHTAAKKQLAEHVTAAERADARVQELNDDLIEDDARNREGIAALSDTDLDTRADTARGALDEAVASLAAHQQSDPALAVQTAQRAYDAVQSVRLERLRIANTELTDLRATRDGIPARRDAELATLTANAERDTRAARTSYEAIARETEARIAAANARLLVQRGAAETLITLAAELDNARAAAAVAIEIAGSADENVATHASVVTDTAANLRDATARATEAREVLTQLAHAGDCYACGQHITDALAEALRATQNDAIATADAAEREARDAHAVAESALRDASDDHARARAAVVTAEREVTRLLNGQVTLESEAKQVATTEAEITSARESLAGHAARLDQTLASITAQETESKQAVTAAAEANLADVTTRGKAAAGKVSELQVPTAEEKTLKAEYDAAAAIAASNTGHAETTERLTAARDQARTDVAAYDAERGRRAEVARRQADRAARITTAKAELESAQEQVSVHTELVAAYSPSGIPSMILESAIEDLNDAINVTLTELSGGALTVRLSTTREKTDGTGESKVTVYVDTPTGPRSYDALSGGQRFRVDLAIRTGLAAIVARGTGTPIETFILDEGWGALDEAGIRSTLEVLGTLSERLNVLTVSHIDSVREAFPARIEVSSREGTAAATVIR
ncbi:SMC family ATPase [Microbacterium sp. 77mftsu3.1]|uniref:AAA family ATPase n=1 Tax=Microbacterium sp. 77mftsu3.1 TaxID=1761802 RepID=UPI0003763F55|nr:SMC family ATPase [Microbacterium sp. 77mftsu3.1]SDH43623.1 DNA repair exonuclease SbcCD ATPase subunit [Microbacterium sp. 77mftsu3.1]